MEPPRGLDFSTGIGEGQFQHKKHPRGGQTSLQSDALFYSDRTAVISAAGPEYLSAGRRSQLFSIQPVKRGSYDAGRIRRTAAQPHGKDIRRIDCLSDRRCAGRGNAAKIFYSYSLSGSISHQSFSSSERSLAPAPLTFRRHHCSKERRACSFLARAAFSAPSEEGM